MADNFDIDALLDGEISDYALSEWTGSINGQEITLYAKPMTAADNAIVLRKCPNFNVNMEFSGMVEYILVKALHSDGKTKVFNPAKHRPKLMRVSQDKIADIFRTLWGDQVMEDDDKVGNF